MRLVIVGGGPAALATARAYREAGGDGDVTILTPELTVPYQRPPLSQGVPARRDWRTRRPADRAAGVVRANTASTSASAREADTLDPARARVALGTGETLRYDACVLATGAEPTPLPVPGATEEWVLLLRSLADGARAARPGRDGRERDRDRLGLHRLRGRRLARACAGSKVTLVTDEAIPHGARLGEEAGARIAGWLEAARRRARARRGRGGDRRAHASTSRAAIRSKRS